MLEFITGAVMVGVFVAAIILLVRAIGSGPVRVVLSVAAIGIVAFTGLNPAAVLVPVARTLIGLFTG